ncbi:MAG: flagellar basal body P-ring formation protein FlgA [Candidatus Solibacter usitatus]|nr:flagellar basal body P-ring formation protein FlgA [Candidatus Solibacter usitatus]
MSPLFSLVLLTFRMTDEAAGACLLVAGERITAGDLAGFAPALARIPGGMDFGLAPQPGLTRTIGASELRRFASRHGVELSGVEMTGVDTLCVRRPASPVARAAVEDALRRALPEEAKAELVDYSRMPVPDGVLEFDSRHLLRSRDSPPGQAVVWRGRVRYGAARTVPFWAKVRVTVVRRRLHAARPVRAGETLTSKHVTETEDLVAFPAPPGELATAAAANGLESRRSIAAGQLITRDMLVEPRLVRRGDRVAVRVDAGPVRLAFEGAALTGGRRGQPAVVENRETGVRFSGRIEEAGQVAVRIDEGGKNAHKLHAAEALDPRPALSRHAAGGAGR